MSNNIRNNNSTNKANMGNNKKNTAKKLSFISIYFLGINGIIGSGVFLLPNEIYQQIGVVSIFVLLCSAATVSMVALCYADLSSRFSGSGAAWLYSYNAFGKFAGYQVGIYSWLLGCLTLAAESVALVRTLKSIYPIFKDDFVRYLFPVCLIILLCVINLFGTGIVKKVDNVSSAFKIIAVIFFICIGVFLIKKANFSPILPTEVDDGGSFIKHFGSAFSTTFYMFTGFSFVPVAAGRMHNPQKNIPKALITVMLSVTVLYCLVQTIVIGILGPNITKYDTPVAEAMKQGIGMWAFAIIMVGMVVSIAGVAFAISFSTPILVSSLAREHKLFPRFMGKRNKNGAPINAIIVSGVLAIVLTKFDYIFLVGAIVLASFIQYVMCVLAVIKFKKTKQFPNEGFKLKGGYTIPVLALLISMYLLLNFKLEVFIFIFLFFVVGTIVYMTVIRKNLNKSTIGHKKN